ncbi:MULTISPECIES: ABC transporter ATP-binding protein [unclassified Pseudactinotalea]|uniref:ABC transporter ATP-binding protein n=2 Tax=unclassified Pseudactinotalea TaxID=2649176 RepID=UPI00128E2E20|nr:MULTISPECIES: ABC transporter ATP-binding protein [unclassified Pseudactinotalea]MPV49211.1 ATP-binding cassette domain-containing protein [Pseudactinotalea sp. HY160]QGH70846.1 ATP-binding cassette domain-containing protein [Pseudactinotalea sp. HY158]
MLRGVGRSYWQGDTQVKALESVDLRIEPADYVAVTGRSGSGKSTLLNLIGLLDQPTAGRYSVADRETTTMSVQATDVLRSRVFGLVFQSFHLVDYLTVSENVEAGLTYTGWSRSTCQTQISESIINVGLQHRSSARASTLSGGERQRVAIARTLARCPSVLLADEPTGNLDQANADIVLDLFEMIRASGVTVLMVTHDEETAARADRRLRMRDGRIDNDA